MFNFFFAKFISCHVRKATWRVWPWLFATLLNHLQNDFWVNLMRRVYLDCIRVSAAVAATAKVDGGSTGLWSFGVRIANIGLEARARVNTRSLNVHQSVRASFERRTHTHTLAHRTARQPFRFSISFLPWIKCVYVYYAVIAGEVKVWRRA